MARALRGPPLQSKAKSELAEVPVRCIRATLDRNKKLGRGVVGSPFVLNEKQVLPLQRSREAEIESNGMYGNIGSQARAKVVIGELRDYRIRIFDRELIQEPYIAKLPDLTKVGGRHHRIAQPVRSDVAGRL